MRGHGSYARYFVRGDGDAEPSPTYQQGAVGFAGEDELGCIDCDVRVGGFVFVVDDAHVDYFGDSGVLFEVGFDGVFVGEAGLVAADGNAETVGCHPWDGGRDV